MLKKLEIIETDNTHAMWREVKIYRNIDRLQEQEGSEGRRQMEAMQRNKVYPLEPNSFKRAFLPQIWCNFPFSETWDPRDHADVHFYCLH